MGQSATVYNFRVALSDLDREVYEELNLSIAREQSETLSYLLTRVLAYAFEFREGIELTRGLADAEQPALWVKDLTGKVVRWIEIGTPKPDRLHQASKFCGSVAVYCHKPVGPYLELLRKSSIYGADRIDLFVITPELLSQMEPLIERRTDLSISVSEGQVYLTVRGADLSFSMEKCPLE